MHARSSVSFRPPFLSINGKFKACKILIMIRWISFCKAGKRVCVRPSVRPMSKQFSREDDAKTFSVLSFASIWAVVVAQLAERLTVCRKDENKEKEAGNGSFFKKSFASNQP